MHVCRVFKVSFQGASQGRDRVGTMRRRSSET